MSRKSPIQFTREEIQREFEENKEEFIEQFLSTFQLIEEHREELEELPTKEMRTKRVKEILKNRK